MKQLSDADSTRTEASETSENENMSNIIGESVIPVENEDYSALKHQFWLTRIVYLRFFAFMYLVAFFIAFHQNSSLIGEQGLTPAKAFIERYRDRFPSAHAAFLAHPTVFWYMEPSNRNLEGLALLGGGISFVILVLGHGSMCMLAVLWLAYMSIVNVGQTWYSFGWESQLLEMGFLSMFGVGVLGGWWVRLWRVVRGGGRRNKKNNEKRENERSDSDSGSNSGSDKDENEEEEEEEEDMLDGRFPAWTRCSWLVVWGNRWLLFRIMLGAGLIKIRGDECWRDLTCMKYHYETQPVPNPVSIYYHSTPEAFHRLETMVNHVVELLAPWLLLFPDGIWREGVLGRVGRGGQMIGGAIQIIFQIVLISSGNLSFLNWLTIVPAIFSFDDAAVAFLFSKRERERAIRVEKRYNAQAKSLLPRIKGTNSNPLQEDHSFKVPLYYAKTVIVCRRILSLLVAGLIAFLSYPVIINIFSPNQVMNASFDSFRIVNTYGAFGSVTKVRHEVVLQATSDSVIAPSTAWKEFQFRCKPGDINRTPCLISPYHFRIDWLMWFAAFQNYQQCPWIVHIAYKLLRGDEVVEDLFDPKHGNPFRGESAPPRFVRAMLYEYRYRRVFGVGKEEVEEEERKNGWELGRYWKRKLVGNYLPVLEKDNPSVQQFLKAHGMI